MFVNVPWIEGNRLHIVGYLVPDLTKYININWQNNLSTVGTTGNDLQDYLLPNETKKVIDPDTRSIQDNILD